MKPVAALLRRLAGVDLTRCPACRAEHLHVAGLLRPCSVWSQGPSLGPRVRIQSP